MEKDGGGSTRQSWMETDTPLGVNSEDKSTKSSHELQDSDCFLKLFPLVTRPLPAAVRLAAVNDTLIRCTERPV